MNKLYIPLFALVAVLLVAAHLPSAADPRPPEEPAKISVEVLPDPVSPGQTARAVVRLAPIDGVKINMYPKIKLVVSGQESLVATARTSIGSAKPPAPDADPEANYFESVDPIELDLVLSKKAPAGSHAVEGKLTYFYCVKASGFCAPKRTKVQFPVVIAR